MYTVITNTRLMSDIRTKLMQDVCLSDKEYNYLPFLGEDTPLCDTIYVRAYHIYCCASNFLIFSGNSEANTSELLENLEECFFVSDNRV